MADIDTPIRLFDVFTEWRVDWLCAAAVAVLAVGYIRLRRDAHRRTIRWPWHRDALVGVGLAAVVWTTSGMLQARDDQLMWVWTTQQLLLLLVVPVVVLAGQPLALVRTVRGPDAPVLRLLDAPPVRWLGHPFLGPLLVPVVAAVLFFGGVGEWSLGSPVAGWVLHLVLLGLGALVAIPLVDRGDERASLAVGAALAVGLVELMVDAFPGIVLTFRHHLMLTTFGANRPAWAGSALADQHLAGGILWAVAEVLDVPFLVLATVAWLRADAREAAAVDTALDQVTADTDSDPVRVRPWWEDDAALRERFRR